MGRGYEVAGGTKKYGSRDCRASGLEVSPRNEVRENQTGSSFPVRSVPHQHIWENRDWADSSFRRSSISSLVPLFRARIINYELPLNAVSIRNELDAFTIIMIVPRRYT